MSASSKTRRVFCNRTLNMRSIRAVGYDMDYTLIHYNMEAWERRAYEHLRKRLCDQGWPVGALEFDPEQVIRGLVIDTKLGNLLKANRFGYVKRAFHGTRPLDFEAQRSAYSRTIVELSDERYVFLNTLFSLSEGCMYAQLVDQLDKRQLPEVLGYSDLYRRVKASLDDAHMEGRLKAEIVAQPDRFVLLDSETPRSLLDQRQAGKLLLLITNSDWAYTRSMMHYAFDRFLPKPMTWRDLFDLVIVSARKPEFFSQRSPLLEIVNEEGLLRPTSGGPAAKGIYFGGSAGLVEAAFGLSGDQILYVGDHMWSDVKVSKSVLRWRTALVLRELEDEIEAMESFRAQEELLARKMAEKETLEASQCQVRLALQRIRNEGGDDEEIVALEDEVTRLREQIAEIDAAVAPLAKAATELANRSWGLLFRTGNEKSHLARQVERSADLYTSRVSNFGALTPFAFLRSHRGTMAHDPTPAMTTDVES